MAVNRMDTFLSACNIVGYKVKVDSLQVSHNSLTQGERSVWYSGAQQSLPSERGNLKRSEYCVCSLVFISQTHLWQILAVLPDWLASSILILSKLCVNW